MKKKKIHQGPSGIRKTPMPGQIFFWYRNDPSPHSYDKNRHNNEKKAFHYREIQKQHWYTDKSLLHSCAPVFHSPWESQTHIYVCSSVVMLQWMAEQAEK